MAPDAVELSGYDVGSVIRRYGDRVVYRGVRRSDGAAVAIDTLDVEYPTRHQVAELRREGAVAQSLADIDGVLRVYDLAPHGSGNLALITEPLERTLASRLSQQAGRGLSVDFVLELAVRLATVLGQIHERDVVHKAVTPHHVLVGNGADDVRLGGFAIASELSRERQGSPMSRRLEGPLPYISPEQTGRMNRDLDYRSDYYSLGVVLFELLTGRRPFAADQPLEWVHSHISRLPPAPRGVNPDIPEAVSRVVLKLLAKSPEDRYQSAEGLIADLRHCQRDSDGAAAGDDFKPGRHDLSQRFLVPQNLYGRERELAQLLSLFESAAAGRTELCLVHGYSGVGKSALVNEIDRPLVRERGFLVQGKFDQFQRGEAHTALATAFRGLVQQILAEPPQRLELWREALLQALGPNAQLVFDLVPELELVLGEQPSVAELPPAEARNRLEIVLTSFVRVFANAEHPLVLFLDDLQWSDVPTLALLKRLVTSRDIGHLLVIGAYRSNEVGPGHPLRLTLDELQAVRNVEEIPLAPLDRDSVANLVADALRTVPPYVRALSDLLYDKARGNPFFTTELLKKLHEEGAISLDTNSGRWRWDLDAARWSGMSGDVVEFMAQNLRQLPRATQQVLQLAACIGGTFNLRTLSVIHERSLGETAGALLPALKRHVVIPLHSDYKLIEAATGTDDTPEPSAFNPSYRFQHDRVQQAAYALIDARRMQAVHRSVGRLMLEHADESQLEECLIDIVGHLNEGRGLIEDEAERMELARMNLRAGVRARRSAAYDAALGYLRVAEELMPGNLWESDPALAMAHAVESQQCAYLTGRLDEAERWTETMLTRAGSELERADVLATRTRQYATLGRMEDSIEAAIEGLALLGVELSVDPSQADIDRERRWVEKNLGRRRVADLVDAPPVDDQATLLAMRLLMEIFPAAFLSGSGRLFPYLVLKAVNLSLRHGNCPESAFAYAAYGMLLCGELDDPALGFEYGRVGLAINERLDDIALRARVIYVYAMFVHHWSNHWASLTPWFRKGIEAGYQSGDLLYLAYSAQDCVIWDPTLDLETAHEQHAENLEIVRECAYQDSLDSATLFLQLQRNLLGLTDGPGSLSDKTFDERACLTGMRERQFMTGIANYHIYKAEACFTHGLYEQALEHVLAQDELIKSAMSLPQLVRFYIVSFLTRTTLYREMDPEQRSRLLVRLQQDLAQMRHWAHNCPENFLHLQYLMEAELDHLGDQADAALARYEAAIDAARSSGFLRDEAVACERAARHLLRLERRRAAEGYLRAAHHIYARWGAQRKVEAMQAEFPVLRELGGVRTQESLDDGTTATPLNTGDLDLASVMKASRAISGEIVLERLLQTTMEILLENAGGQRGCLVVRRDGALAVEARGGGVEATQEQMPDLPEHSYVAGADGQRCPLPVSVVSNVLRTGEAVVLHDAPRHGPFTDDPYIARSGVRSVLCVPIRRERFDSALYMENRLATGVFTQDRVEVIRLLAAQASVAIENARLYEQVQEYSRTLEERVAERTARLEQLNWELQSLAEQDGLTGVANRRRGDAYLQEVWDRLRRSGQPLSVIMLDVDHFKAYNDNYGHQSGDDCLVEVAAAVRAQVRRPADLLARYGGEEFIVILPETAADGAQVLAERIRQSIAALKITHQYSSAGPVVTASLGTATTIPASDDGPGGVVRRADDALYEAKSGGRNRVCGAGS